MKTLLLDASSWDLVLDSAGNIALAAEPYALAQDVASAIRTFLGEVWYDDSLGVPYLSTILGKSPPVIVFQELITAAALKVPGVISASCTITEFQGRTVQGQVTFTDSSGLTGIVALQ